MRSRYRRACAVIATLACLAGITACHHEASGPVNTLDGTARVPEGLESFYAQTVTWHSCDHDTTTATARCGVIHVPLDYANPSGETIDIALLRIPATGTARGSLFVNPGGPGSSGVTFADQLADSLPDRIRDNFDIIGFDPRGVGHSTAITCVEPAQLDAFLDGTLNLPASDPAWHTADNVIATVGDAAGKSGRDDAAAYAWLGQACSASSGDLLAHVDTRSAARDLDIARATVGDDKLSYLGYSYGTYLGVTYIDLFPDNVGRIALDGVLGAGMSMDEVALAQGAGMEASLRHFVDFCLAGRSCPLTGDTETATRSILDFVDSLSETPLKTSTPKRPLTSVTAVTGIIGSLYAEASYPALREALRQAMTQHDGTQLQRLADHYTDRNADGTFGSNSNEAFVAINMLDYPIDGDATSWHTWMQQAASEAPLLVDSSGVSATTQLAWPTRSATTRTWVTGKGAQPALLISSLHDPATPHDMAVRTHEHLIGSRLITLDSWDHTSLNAGSSCVTDILVNYLVDGAVPAEKDITCD
ncbi:alpha/beta fold hydrolase [Nanchangia anserum]|uniref:Alpha/beta fold hydrolase n=1 Tax=Nanchangia anserum TaxID=2692125 RepID=A0A8I0GF26_9ACTO|nr:alpha/beta hydrolase [Nanchangia anserum]MBD3689667.1 alpha/beta fold hydrolase [Nanchangia anserum]QOX81846.1 alpha/beta fold hydrolase [Nanchangia anserum]